MFSSGFGYVFFGKVVFSLAPRGTSACRRPQFLETLGRQGRHEKRSLNSTRAKETKKGRYLLFFFLHLAFESFFLAFWTSKGPSRTTKNHENHITVIKKQGFAILEKMHFQGRFYCPWGTLWASFWSPLRSLGLLLAPFGLPKRFKSRKKTEK